MGVVSIKCTATGDRFFDVAKDIAIWFNRHRFQLDANQHRNKHLQKLWDAYGETGFELATVSELEYGKVADVSADDLKELLELCLLENPDAERL